MSPESKQKKYAYPWAELYDMESRVSNPAAGTGRPGRPHRLYARRRTSLMLSDDELSMLSAAALKLENALRPGTVTKSQVYGLAVRLLDNRLSLLTGRVTSWEDVIKTLLVKQGD